MIGLAADACVRFRANTISVADIIIVERNSETLNWITATRTGPVVMTFTLIFTDALTVTTANSRTAFVNPKTSEGWIVILVTTIITTPTVKTFTFVKPDTLTVTTTHISLRWTIAISTRLFTSFHSYLGTITPVIVVANLFTPRVIKILPRILVANTVFVIIPVVILAVMRTVVKWNTVFTAWSVIVKIVMMTPLASTVMMRTNITTTFMMKMVVVVLMIMAMLIIFFIRKWSGNRIAGHPFTAVNPHPVSIPIVVTVFTFVTFHVMTTSFVVFPAFTCFGVGVVIIFIAYAKVRVNADSVS